MIEDDLTKPSRYRVVEKVDREVRIKDRVPKHPPYKRKHDNLVTKYIQGEYDDDDTPDRDVS